MSDDSTPPLTYEWPEEEESESLRQYLQQWEEEEDEDLRREVQVERLNELLEGRLEQGEGEQRGMGVSVEVQTEEPEVTRGRVIVWIIVLLRILRVI